MAENQIDILINSYFNGKGVDKALNDVDKLLNTVKKYNRLAEMASKVGLNLNISDDGILTFMDKLTGKTVGYGSAIDKISKSNDLEKRTMSQKKALDNLGKSFAMEYLGILFFGMQIKALFEGVARSTLASFMKITEGSTSQGQAINALTATWELLKFSIGSALGTVLEGLLPVLLPIIESIADWIQRNETLVGWIILGGIALGAFLMIVGSLYIGIQAIGNGFINFGKVLGLVTASTTEAGTAMTVFNSAALMPLLATIGWIIVIVALLYAAWVANFGGIREFLGETLGIIWDLIKTVFGGIWDIVKTVLDIVVAIFEGDWNRVLKLLGKVFIQIIRLLIDLGAQIGAVLINIGIFVHNITLDIVKSILKLIVSLATGIVNVFFDLAKKMITLIAKPFDFIAEKINSAIKTLSSVPGFGWLKKFKIPTSSNVIDTLTDVQTLVDGVETAGNNLIDNIFKNQEFISRDSVKGFTDKIDSVAQGWIDVLDIQERVSAPAVETPSTSPLAAFSNISAAIANLNTQTAAATQTSQSMAVQNAAETQSWTLKNEEIQKNIDLMKQVNSMKTSISSGNSFEFDRAVGNFVINRA